MVDDFAVYRESVGAAKVYSWVNRGPPKELSIMVVRIGTWNLENLFKPPSQFAPKTQLEYDAKLDALAGTITAMDPHVLAVQEVGDPVALHDLADRVGGTWHIETAAPEAGTDHAIRVGILSRVALDQPEQVSAFPDKLRAIQHGDGPHDDPTTGAPCPCRRISRMTAKS